MTAPTSTETLADRLQAAIEGVTPGPWTYVGTGSEGGSILWSGRGRVARLDSLDLKQINADAAAIAFFGTNRDVILGALRERDRLVDLLTRWLDYCDRTAFPKSGLAAAVGAFAYDVRAILADPVRASADEGGPANG